MHKSVFKIRKRQLVSINLQKRNENSSRVCSGLDPKLNTTCMSFNEIPGPKSYRFVGSLHKYLPVIGDYSAEALDKNAWLNWRRYGPLTRESLQPDLHLLHVVDPQDIETVFRLEDKLPERRSHVAMKHYRLSKPAVYNTGGLLSTNGPEWWRLRSTFQKNFTSPKSVKSHIGTTDEIARQFVKWIRCHNTNPSPDFLPFLNRFNLEVIGVVAFNERFNCFSAEEQLETSCSSRIIDAAFGSNSGIVKLDKGFLWKLFKTPLYARLMSSQEILEKVAEKILLKNVTFFEKEATDSSNVSLLQSFLRLPSVDLKDITGMMVDILMASIDTAVYARSCIKEALRLNPVSIGVGRVLQKDIALRGYLVPKGTVIVTQNMLACRLPQFVKDPLLFKPERWLKNSEHHEALHPFLSLPFGFGPRSCIARRLAEQTMAIALIRIVREFKLSWSGGEMGIKTHLINKPDQPVRLSLEPRV
ncbi:hypothetical protein JYU34_016381 [Plutella xylostella]|uniref:Cytochrome P450 302a1, mitochondrial n=1 Tax=Plutella xylostella TaxID=51655 RepID=A0ABQ7Q2G0_PLUXY|nr:hypothetical protein JYU34_016381 [Plutella xylostella]